MWGSHRQNASRGDLVLPGQLAPTDPLPNTTAPLQDFTARLKADMAAAKYPQTAWHSGETKPQIPAALARAEFVFVRHGAWRIPLTRPYDGPYRVKKRGEKYFVLQVGTKEQVISIDRLKPAFGFADPAPLTSRAPAADRTPTPRTRIPGTLDPEAEEFSPATTRSRFGRVSRPPVRLGL